MRTEKNRITIILKNNKAYLNGCKPKPKDRIAISSLSLFNFIKQRRRPKIKINGTIIVTILGNKKNDSNLCQLFQYT